MAIARHPRRPPAPRFHECPDCRLLTDDIAFGSCSSPCPRCGSTAPRGRRAYPNDRIRRLDERVRGYHDEGESEIVVILVAAFLEAILEDILDRLMSSRGADVTVRSVVLDGQRAVGGRIGRLFPHLTGEQFEEAASELGYGDFPGRWHRVRAARNAFIHDSPFNPGADPIDDAMAGTAMELLDQAYELFVLINNRFATGKDERPA